MEYKRKRFEPFIHKIGFDAIISSYKVGAQHHRYVGAIEKK